MTFWLTLPHRQRPNVKDMLDASMDTRTVDLIGLLEQFDVDARYLLRDIRCEAYGKREVSGLIGETRRRVTDIAADLLTALTGLQQRQQSAVVIPFTSPAEGDIPLAGGA